MGDGFVVGGTEGQMRRRLLAAEAARWVGVLEQGGANRGQLVQMFQRAVDGRAEGEPWCLAFVQWCLRAADRQADAAFAQSRQPNVLPATEHCLTLWERAPAPCRRDAPAEGLVMLWRHGSTQAGHAGVVTAVRADGQVETVEGNTGAGPGVEREGDGVFARVRSPAGSGDMRVLGWLDPWPGR